MASKHDKTANKVTIKNDIFIEMSDGVQISTKIWFPDDYLINKQPIIFEFIPYRKSDASSMRDYKVHYFFAENGYISVRADMRGHGDSEGTMEDEYSKRERQDALEIIEWLAAQPWCNGNIGMMGISWGGIASLQATMKAPKALKAIIAVGASLDRYYDDGAYLVGGYPGQGLGWGGVMFHYCSRPPHKDIVGEKWKEMWQERIEKTPLYAAKWLAHQLRDETWVDGSICEDYDSIKTPTLAISGWYDCWPNTIIRALENIKNTYVKCISGSWAHIYPHINDVHHPDNFQNTALQWWNYWLKEDTSCNVLDSPSLKAYIQTSHKANPHETIKPGYWVEENIWPSKNISSCIYNLTDDLINDHLENEIIIKSPLSTGLDSGEYMPIYGAAEYPQDQRKDDARSVCFDSKPLDNDMEILGTIHAHLRLKSSTNQGLIVVRLCDVSSDGASNLISYGLLNLKLRHGKGENAPVKAEEFMDVIVRLNDTGWRLEKRA